MSAPETSDGGDGTGRAPSPTGSEAQAKHRDEPSDPPTPGHEPQGAVRWIDLTPAEIADLAHQQIMGGFGPMSDALTALHLIEALAQRLADTRAALSQSKGPDHG